MADDAKTEKTQPAAAIDAEATLKQVEEVEFGTARVVTVSPADSLYSDEGNFVGTDPIYQTPEGGSREAKPARSGVEKKLEEAHKAAATASASEPPAAVKKNYESVSAGVSGVTVVQTPTEPSGSSEGESTGEAGENEGDSSDTSSDENDGSSQQGSQQAPGGGLLD